MAGPNDYLFRHAKAPVITIANGAATSSIFYTDGYAMYGFQLPAAFTGATIKFSVSADGVTFTDLYDATNTLISIPVTQGRAYPFPDEASPWGFIKLVSGSNEAGARSIVLAARA